MNDQKRRVLPSCTSTLHPRANGTKKLHDQYGRKLLAVRYRVDAKKKIRYKTVEIIVDQRPLKKKKH